MVKGMDSDAGDLFAVGACRGCLGEKAMAVQVGGGAWMLAMYDATRMVLFSTLSVDPGSHDEYAQAEAARRALFLAREHADAGHVELLRSANWPVASDGHVARISTVGGNDR
jgi:hypothetical protein